MIKDFLFQKMECCSQCNESNPFFAQKCFSCKQQLKTKDEAMSLSAKMAKLLRKANIIDSMLLLLIACAIIATIWFPNLSYREVKAVEYNKDLATGKLCYLEISSEQYLFSLENKAYSNYQKTPAYSENSNELFFDNEGDCYLANVGETEIFVFVSKDNAEKFSNALAMNDGTLGAYCRVTTNEAIRESCETQTKYLVDMFLKDKPGVEFISFDEVTDEEKSGLGPGGYAIIIGIVLLIIRLKLKSSLKWAWKNSEALNADK